METAARNADQALTPTARRVRLNVRGLARAHPTVLAFAVAILLWEIAGRTLGFIFLPPFSEVLRASWRMIVSGEIPINLAASLIALALGFGAAVLVGVPLGLLIGSYYVGWGFVVLPAWVFVMSVHILIDNLRRHEKPDAAAPGGPVSK